MRGEGDVGGGMSDVFIVVSVGHVIRAVLLSESLLLTGVQPLHSLGAQPDGVGHRPGQSQPKEDVSDLRAARVTDGH